MRIANITKTLLWPVGFLENWLQQEDWESTSAMTVPLLRIWTTIVPMFIKATSEAEETRKLELGKLLTSPDPNDASTPKASESAKSTTLRSRTVAKNDWTSVRHLKVPTTPLPQQRWPRNLNPETSQAQIPTMHQHSRSRGGLWGRQGLDFTKMSSSSQPVNPASRNATPQVTEARRVMILSILRHRRLRLKSPRVRIRRIEILSTPRRRKHPRSQTYWSPRVRKKRNSGVGG